MYYRRAVGCLVVFDLTRPESLYNLENWLEELVQNSGSPKIAVIILGNKIDMRDVSPKINIIVVRFVIYITWT